MKPSDLLQPVQTRGASVRANAETKRAPKPADLSDVHKQVRKICCSLSYFAIQTKRRICRKCLIIAYTACKRIVQVIVNNHTTVSYDYETLVWHEYKKPRVKIIVMISWEVCAESEELIWAHFEIHHLMRTKISNYYHIENHNIYNWYAMLCFRNWEWQLLKLWKRKVWRWKHRSSRYASRSCLQCADPLLLMWSARALLVRIWKRLPGPMSNKSLSLRDARIGNEYNCNGIQNLEN